MTQPANASESRNDTEAIAAEMPNDQAQRTPHRRDSHDRTEGGAGPAAA